MKQTPDEDLTPLAEAVSDGSVVDWESETTRRPDLAPLVRELQVLETLASASRGMPTREEEEVARVLGQAPPTAPIGRWGPLLLIEKLGRGGFGEVYRAYDPGLQREVALKLVRPDRLSEEAADQLLKEARRLARVRHPNVVVVHGVDRHDGAIGIWSDMVQGLTLEDLLTQQGPLGGREASLIGIELTRALAAVHAAGLVHRDIKTTNVMREEGGRIVLTDFGAASEATDPSTAGYGTPLATAPEVLRGKAATPAADLYSLGVLLYRLTSGRYPIEAQNLGELLAKLDSGARVPLRDRRPDLPADFVRSVEASLEADPARRFATAGAMESDLAGLAPVGEAGARHRRAWTWWVAAAVVSTVVIAFMTTRGGVGRRSEPPVSSSLDVGGSGARPRVLAGSTPEVGSPSVPVALVATATLHRDRAGQQITLAPGDRVAPGDGLFLELSCTEAFYAYVLNEDEQGETFVLFPAPGLDMRNPLAGGVSHRLPGKRGGEPFDWQVTSAGGSETVVVVASRGPLEAFEREIGKLVAASPDREVASPPVDTSAVASLRGIGGMRAASGAGRPAGSRLDELLFKGRRNGDPPWVWRIRLENAGR